MVSTQKSNASISLRHFRAFLAVARLGSFTRAAERLSLSQPALTICIQQLEDLVGISLFDRTTRRVRLTTAGEDFLPTAEQVIHDIDMAIANIQAVAEGQEGRVFIGSIPSVSTQWLPALISEFAREFPKASIRVYDDNSNGVRQRVRRGDVDFGFSSQGANDADLRFRPLAKEPIGLVCLKSHRLAQSDRPLRWADLEGETVLRKGYEEWFRSVTEVAPSLTSTLFGSPYNVSNVETLVAMIQSGLGVTIMPSLAFPRLKAMNGSFVFRPLAEPKLERIISLVQRRDHSLSPVASILLKRILDFIASTEIFAPDQMSPKAIVTTPTPETTAGLPHEDVPDLCRI